MRALDTAFPGNPLDEVGRDQAEGLPARLAASGGLEGISCLCVSPILRARQTMAPLESATGLTARVDAGLREVLAGDLEMNTDVRSMRCYTDTTRAWMVGRTGARIPGSHEDGADTFERFHGAVTRIAHSTPESGTALLVAHGTVLRLWTALAAAPTAGADPAWIAEHPMRNAGISVVEGDPATGWRLVTWNEGEWAAGDAGAAVPVAVTAG